MELGAARFCRGSSVVHKEQVTLRCVTSLCYHHQLHKLISSASEVGRDGEQVVAEREKVKNYPLRNDTGAKNDTEWLKRSQWLPGAGL